ncbi:LpqB family beta-propeller domain-containing protein [Nonomuraea diastatica]|uniref:GerMN domain-containing protein n=1 Tax=Nonomuraea diastatica TaxID=1848329 RepID=A0A4R4VYB7_9ACTN|nr:LpqB family beta-propeller domain-containing protein [Nonomuraea diastatica]TDD07525.1 hypothetical protein E1294_48160 [Nonomuraea diastatica]
MTTIRRLGAAVAIVLAMVAAGTGCTVIPVTGPYTVGDDGTGGDPLNKPFQRMIAMPPQPNWGPEDTIKGLQAAMAAYADDPSILPQYLTPEARAKWSATGPVKVIEDAFEITYPTPRDGTETVLQVTLKAQWVASIGTDDAYAPTAGAWDGGTFELVKTQQGGYLVNKLPAGLLLTNSDVVRAYRPANLYYMNADMPERLVVDRVRLRMKPTESFARTILERLLKEPTAALRDAVTTSFPEGTTIESIRWNEERVLVNLSGPLDPLDLSAEAALRAQIRHSFADNDVAKGRIIEIQVDGETYAVDRPDPADPWLDDGGDTAYFVDNGAVHFMGKEGPAGAVPGAAGEQRAGYTDFALSKEETALIAAKTSTGISLTKLAQDGRWQEVIQGTELTPPTFHRDGSLWTYDNKNGVLLRYDPASGRGPERVSAPKLAGLDVARLRIARDGVRVSVTTGENTVQIGALTSTPEGLVLGNFRSLTTTEVGDEIVDVTWSDDEHLLVLVESKAGQILNEINVGDGETVGVPLKDRLVSLAALDDRVLGEVKTDKETKIVELNPDRQTWVPKVESNAGSPLFPLG